jgi:hypothetical protein
VKKNQRKVSITKDEEFKGILFQCPEKQPIDQLLKDYKEAGEDISEAEGTELRDFLYTMGEIIFKSYQNEKEKKLLINQNFKNEKSHIIHTSEYRRAS